MLKSMPTVSRRTLLKWTLGAAGTSLLAACGQQASAPAAQEAKPAAPAPTQAVQIAVPTPAQQAPAQAAAASPTAAAAAAAKPTDAPAAAKPTDAPKPAAAANAQVKRGGS